MDLREKVAKAIHESNCVVPWDQTCQQDIAYERADAAIKAVLDALKEPSDEMLDQGVAKLETSIWVPPSDVWRVMLVAFTRDHYLSTLAEEDGKDL